MTLEATSVISLVIFLEITGIILIGCFSYRFAKCKSPCDISDNTSLKKKNDSSETEKGKAHTAPEAVLPGHAKVSAEASFSNKQPKGRPAPVIIMLSGSTERPTVKRIIQQPQKIYN